MTRLLFITFLFGLSFNVSALTANDVINGYEALGSDIAQELRSKESSLRQLDTYSQSLSSQYSQIDNWINFKSQSDLEAFVTEATEALELASSINLPGPRILMEEIQAFEQSIRPNLANFSNDDIRRISFAANKWKVSIGKLFQHEAMIRMFVKNRTKVEKYLDDTLEINWKSFNATTFQETMTLDAESCVLSAKPIFVNNRLDEISLDIEGLSNSENEAIIYYEKDPTDSDGASAQVKLVYSVSFKLDEAYFLKEAHRNMPGNTCRVKLSTPSNQLVMRYDPINAMQGKARLRASLGVNYEFNTCSTLTVPCISTSHCCSCEKEFKNKVASGSGYLTSESRYWYDTTNSTHKLRVAQYAETKSGFMKRHFDYRDVEIPIDRLVEELNVRSTAHGVDGSWKLKNVTFHEGDVRMSVMNIWLTGPTKSLNKMCYLQDQLSL